MPVFYRELPACKKHDTGDDRNDEHRSSHTQCGACDESLALRGAQLKAEGEECAERNRNGEPFHSIRIPGEHEAHRERNERCPNPRDEESRNVPVVLGLGFDALRRRINTF